MIPPIDRRDLLRLLSVGGVAFASGLVGCAKPVAPRARAEDDFFFVQISDTHVGYRGPANPEADTTLDRAVATLNESPVQPDFVVFTGDLTHTTDDVGERRARMARFRDSASRLRAKNLRFLPGEHDAALDRGDAFREAFGDTHGSFDHKGVHFVMLDNVSDARGVGDVQLAWLEADLQRAPADVPIVVFTHRPLFDLHAPWDWTTADGARAIEVLDRRGATVFYGHIHQEHHHTTGRVAHHAGRSLVFPLPAPASVPKRAPLPWDASAKDHGLGTRRVHPWPTPRIEEVIA
jgi:3',5'-cyclic AMP phosphodiesterase CpdA